MTTSLNEFFMEHLPYEIRMTRCSLLALSTSQLGTFETNAFIETFRLHARTLIEFFKVQGLVRVQTARLHDA
jgi:hypothetical protein